MSVCDASMNQARTTTFVFFFFNDTATTEIYTLSLHDALPILPHARVSKADGISGSEGRIRSGFHETCFASRTNLPGNPGDRKSTRLNSSHLVISYAVFCLKKKKTNNTDKYYLQQQKQRY